MEKIYETPTIEVVEIEVENGFAASVGTESMWEQEGAWS